jgi:hypothetical protein
MAAGAGRAEGYDSGALGGKTELEIRGGDEARWLHAS